MNSLTDELRPPVNNSANPANPATTGSGVDCGPLAGPYADEIAGSDGWEPGQKLAARAGGEVRNFQQTFTSEKSDPK